MAKLIPIEQPVDNTEKQSTKTLKLVPVQEQEKSNLKLVPVQQKQEREKIDQPLLREVNSTSVKDVPESLLLLAKQAVVDIPFSMGSFVGGAATDIGKGLTTGKWNLDNARSSYEYAQNLSKVAYDKVRSLLPGDSQGSEQIIQNIFSPLEKFATKGGEIVTDLTDSPVAGAAAYGTLQVLPFVIGGKAIEAIKKPKLPVEDLSYAKELESGISENPKQTIIDTKSAIIDKIAENIKDVDSNPQVVKDIQTLKQINDSFGVSNAGEIQEGKEIILGTQRFVSTDNIKESQKSIAAIKEESAKVAESLSKQSRRDLIKERVEAYKRKKEIEEMSHYEDTPDPLTINTEESIQNALFKESESKTPVTLQGIKDIAKKNELGVDANIGANGDMVIQVMDKRGNKTSFPIGNNGVQLEDVHSYVKRYTDNFAESMQKQYELKSSVIENAPELVKKEGPIRKHIIKQTGETIEYQTVGDLKAEYESRGLPWTSNKKEYYTKKKIDEKRKIEIDDKLTPVSQKSLPEIELLDSQGNGKKAGVGSWIDPFRQVAFDIEERTGFPMSQFDMKIRDGLRQVSSSTIPYEKRLREAKRGMNYESSVRIYKALESPSFRESQGNYLAFRKSILKDKELSNVFSNMSRSEYESAGKIRKILNDAAEEFGVPVDKMVMDYAPRMRKDGIYSWEEAFTKYKLPEEYKWAQLENRTGYLNPHEENIFKVTQKYIRRGANKRYIGNYLEQLSEEANKFNWKSDKNPDIMQIKRYIDVLRGYQTGFDQTIINSGEVVVRHLNNMINKSFNIIGKEGSRRYINPTYEKFEVEKKLFNQETGKVENVKIPRYEKISEEPGFFDTQQFANDFLNLHLKLSYMGGIALRPMVWARATYQSTLAMPIVGPSWYAKGFYKAMTPSGWNEARVATALLQDSPIAAGELSRGWTALDDFTQKMTWDTRSGHNVSRVISYHAGKERAAFFGEKFLENIKNGMPEEQAISKFIDKSGADFFHPVLIKNEIVPLLKSRDIASLSERMGLHVTAETQWLYEKAQSPYWAKSMAGRVMGQFGVWPSWYIRYAKNLMTRGSKVNIAKRLAIFGGVNAMALELGKEVFGVDISSWLYSHPFMWQPVPVQAWTSARKMLGGRSDYEKEQGSNEIMNLVKLHIPAYISIKDVINGMEETRDEDKLKRMMGFKPAED